MSVIVVKPPGPVGVLVETFERPLRHLDWFGRVGFGTFEPLSPCPFRRYSRLRSADFELWPLVTTNWWIFQGDASKPPGLLPFLASDSKKKFS